MKKLLITYRSGKTVEKVVNTATAHRLLSVPSVAGGGAVKCEIVKEQEKTQPPVVTVIKNDYTDENYQADLIQAKTLKDEVPKEVLERMVAFKPTPYWKGKLNKIK